MRWLNAAHRIPRRSRPWTRVLLCGSDTVGEAEAVVQMEALLSLAGLRNHVLRAVRSRPGAWNPRVGDGSGKRHPELV